MTISEAGIDKDKLAGIVEKIRKLLALGTSSNEHEAALAVAKARELLAAYDLTMETVENLKADKRTAVRKGQDATVRVVDGKPDGWKADLFETVASTSDCLTTYLRETEEMPSGRRRSIRKGYLVGFGHDVEMAGYAFSFLVAEIERHAQAYADVMWQEIKRDQLANQVTHQEAESAYVERTGRHPLKAKLYFIKGAASTVIDGLNDAWRRREREAQQAQEDARARGEQVTAIVVRKRETVEDFLYQERYGMSKADYRAKIDKEHAEWLANRPAPEPEPVKQETEAQRRKRERSEAKAWERAQRSWENKQARVAAATDRRAVEAGEEAGRGISVRPGLGAGNEPERIR